METSTAVTLVVEADAGQVTFVYTGSDPRSLIDLLTTTIKDLVPLGATASWTCNTTGQWEVRVVSTGTPLPAK